LDIIIIKDYRKTKETLWNNNGRDGWVA